MRQGPWNLFDKTLSMAFYLLCKALTSEGKGGLGGGTSLESKENTELALLERSRLGSIIPPVSARISCSRGVRGILDTDPPMVLSTK